MWKLSGLWFLIFLFLRASGHAHGTEFDFGTLTLGSLKLLGDAHLKNSTIRLTRDLSVPNSGAGRALYAKPIKFLHSKVPISFSTFFSFSISNLNPSSIGGGLAFIVTSDDQSIGDAGGYLGLVNSTDATAVTIALEFDTLMDVEFKDINGNHVGFDLNSLVSSQVADLDSIDVNLKSGNLVNAWIDYDGATQVCRLFVSYANIRPVSPLLSFNLSLDQYVNEYMFVGFSGSTQGSTETHSIEWWSFSSEKTEISPSESAPPPPPPPPPQPTFYYSPAGDSSKTPPSYAPLSAPPNPQNTGRSSCHNQLCKKDPAAVAGVVTAGTFFLAILAGVFIWVFSKKLKSDKNAESLPSEVIRSPREFTYKELKFATRGFDPVRIIGHGAFGTVYKGIIPDTGAIVAVKRCSHGGAQGRDEFLSELSIIGTLRHRNLVRLRGWCHEKGEILLVYDYMPNGSLDKALFEAKTPLPWTHRRKILAGVASALTYLHQECENQVIHRDVKASNIMLDEGYNARLGDFGLARQVEHDKSPEATIAAGTMGYLAPEYLLTGRATDKTDVFSYGAVILEVVCGRRPIEKDVGASNANNGGNLVEWVWSLYRDERLLEAADSRLAGEYEEGEMRRVLLVGLICSHPDPNQRPSMRNVVQMLGGEAALPYVPISKPCLSFDTASLLMSLEDSVSDYNGIVRISTSSSSGSFNG
ncbi:L-type lectin-domain containing receptor kinase VIII.1-like [Aristolochia californica]|uniref:L-type lectin-domain containing receptor kinase VIII.1-like n=1 Tax=Aristolochia californica TaxID=171875 RepID=UPI0035DBC19E